MQRRQPLFILLTGFLGAVFRLHYCSTAGWKHDRSISPGKVFNYRVTKTFFILVRRCRSVVVLFTLMAFRFNLTDTKIHLTSATRIYNPKNRRLDDTHTVESTVKSTMLWDCTLWLQKQWALSNLKMTLLLKHIFMPPFYRERCAGITGER